jgi:hypothetical protein
MSEENVSQMHLDLVIEPGLHVYRYAKESEKKTMRIAHGRMKGNHSHPLRKLNNAS